MGFELSYEDIGILFFLTLGPLKAILSFARVTRETEPAFQRTVAWRAVTVATAIVLVVAVLGPIVLTNWHVSSPAIIITGGIVLFYQALRIITERPPGAPTSARPETSAPERSPAIAVFPLAIPAIVTAHGIAANDSRPQQARFGALGDCRCTVACGDGAQLAHIVGHPDNTQARFGRGVAGRRMGIGGAAGFARCADGHL